MKYEKLVEQLIDGGYVEDDIVHDLKLKSLRAMFDSSSD